MATLYRPVDPITVISASMPPLRGLTVPPSMLTDLNLVRVTRANLLLVGGVEPVVTDLVRLATPDPAACVTIRRHGRLQLPPPSLPIGTAVLQDADALTADEQRALLDWLDAGGSDTQVISTASQPLLERVESGMFSASLYYRLNTVYIDLAD